MEKDLEEWKELHKFYRYYGYLTKDLAAYLKVSPRTIQRWLKGKTRPNPEKLNRIKKYLSDIAKEEASE
jgi:transcriptional regulator with XRE-family HTH domain